MQQWLQYMDLFDEFCISNWYAVDDCVRKILAKMNVTEVNKSRDPAATLELWKKQEQEYGFDSFPEVGINNMIYRGNFDTDEIVQALC